MTKTTPTPRPLILPAEDVRAILAGRKTQHRVPVRPMPEIQIRQIEKGCAEVIWQDARGLANAGGGTRNGGLDILSHLAEERCPFGRVGEQIWVRETWSRYRPFAGDPTDTILYAADLDECGQCPIMLDGEVVYVSPRDGWRSPVTMPRAASRLTLELTGVRVERVQDITEEDARAEGVEALGSGDCDVCGGDSCPGCQDSEEAYPGCRGNRLLFAEAWDTLNAARGFGWNVNPWVWVLGFRPVEPVNLTRTNEG